MGSGDPGAGGGVGTSALSWSERDPAPCPLHPPHHDRPHYLPLFPRGHLPVLWRDVAPLDEDASIVGLLPCVSSLGRDTLSGF